MIIFLLGQGVQLMSLKTCTALLAYFVSFYILLQMQQVISFHGVLVISVRQTNYASSNLSLNIQGM